MTLGRGALIPLGVRRPSELSRSVGARTGRATKGGGDSQSRRFGREVCGNPLHLQGCRGHSFNALSERLVSSTTR